MGNLFSSHLAGDAGAPEANVSGGLPLSEADGMPSLSGMSPSDAAAFLQSNKKASLVSGRLSCGWCTSVWRHMPLRILKMPASTLRAGLQCCQSSHAKLYRLLHQQHDTCRCMHHSLRTWWALRAFMWAAR